jgi:hypothetical protein
MQFVSWEIKADWKHTLPNLLAGINNKVRFTLADDKYIVGRLELDPPFLNEYTGGIPFDELKEMAEEFSAKYPMENSFNIYYEIYGDDDHHVWAEFFGLREMTPEEASDMAKLRALVNQSAIQLKEQNRKTKIGFAMKALIAEGVLTTEEADKLLSMDVAQG